MAICGNTLALYTSFESAEIKSEGVKVAVLEDRPWPRSSLPEMRQTRLRRAPASFKLSLRLASAWRFRPSSLQSAARSWTIGIFMHPVLRSKHSTSRDTTDEGLENFSNCGRTCLFTARLDSTCTTDDDIECMCQNLDARNQASDCMSNECLDLDWDNDSARLVLAVQNCGPTSVTTEPGPTTHAPSPSPNVQPLHPLSSTQTLTTHPLSTTSTSTTETSASGTLPVTTTAIITTTTTETTESPTPPPTKGAGSTRGDSPIVSTGTNPGTTVSASRKLTYSSSTHSSTNGTTLDALRGPSSAFTSSTPTSGFSLATFSAQTPDDSVSHGVSPKVTIVLSAALGFMALVAVVLATVSCIFRRQSRSRGTLPHAHILERPQAGGRDANRVGRGDIHLAVIDIHSSLAAPNVGPRRASSIQTSKGVIISPPTSPHSPQSEAGDSVGPLLSHIVSGSGTTEPQIGEGAPPWRRASSQGSDTWSKYGVVGEATQANGETHSVGHAAGSGAGERGGSWGVGKSTTLSGVQATVGRRRRLSLPATPATMKPPPAAPLPAGTSASSAGTSSGARHGGPRFVPVTVLMEVMPVREDSDLEEHDQPPPYEPRS